MGVQYIGVQVNWCNHYFSSSDVQTTSGWPHWLYPIRLVLLMATWSSPSWSLPKRSSTFWPLLPPAPPPVFSSLPPSLNHIASPLHHFRHLSFHSCWYSFIKPETFHRWQRRSVHFKCDQSECHLRFAQMVNTYDPYKRHLEKKLCLSCKSIANMQKKTISHVSSFPPIKTSQGP